MLRLQTASVLFLRANLLHRYIPINLSPGWTEERERVLWSLLAVFHACLVGGPHLKLLTNLLLSIWNRERILVLGGLGLCKFREVVSFLSVLLWETCPTERNSLLGKSLADTTPSFLVPLE